MRAATQAAQWHGWLATGDVAEAAVIGVPDGRRGETGLAAAGGAVPG